MFRRNLLQLHKTITNYNKYCTKVQTPLDAHTLKVVCQKVDPFPNIKINNFNYNLKIKPYDPIECPESNLLRASLLLNGTESKEGFKTSLNVEVVDKIVTISADTGQSIEKSENITCLLEVPIKSDLEIDSLKDVNIEKLYCDFIKLNTAGNVTTKNIQGTKFDINSENGDINCTGTTLANQIFLRVRADKNMHLDKMQGDLMYAICDSGNITTNACYVEASKFVSLKGGLFLRNVHKFAEVYLLEGGTVDMTGVHGQLQVKTNGGNLKFQITEIYSESFIIAKNTESISVNISEFVEENTVVKVTAKTIELHDSLKHLADYLQENGIIRLNNVNEELSNDKLTIDTDGLLKLGKMSWTDTIKLKMGVTD